MYSDRTSPKHGQPIGVARNHGGFSNIWESRNVRTNEWFSDPEVLGEITGILGRVPSYEEYTEEEANAIIEMLSSTDK